MLLSISDTGIGIPSHEIQRIFEKFYRVHQQEGRSHEGSGIGLALTQELVKLHGGRIDVDSTYGRGTTFSIYIPVGNGHLPPEQVFHAPDVLEMEDFTLHVYGQSVVEEAGRWVQPDVPAEIAISPSAGHLVPLSSRGSRILVVDDNEDMRLYVKGILRQYYETLEASNGQEALAIALQTRPDMIISDIMMSGLDGYGQSFIINLNVGLLKVIRSSPEIRSMPFILLSARAGDEARVEGLTAGADDYLAKPFSAKELIARVHAHLDIARMRSVLEKRVKERTKDLLESEGRYR